MDDLNNTINKISPLLTSIYNKIEEKGGTIPENKNIHNLGAAIRTISTTPPEPIEDWGTLYTTDYPEGFPITNEAQYKALAPEGGFLNTTDTITLGDKTITVGSIIEYDFGEKCTQIPDWFMSGCVNLHTTRNKEVVLAIGDWCFNDTAISLVSYPNATSIGNNFGLGLTSSGVAVMFGEALLTIGSNFLQGTAGITGMTIPANIQSIGHGFLNNCDNFTGILYVNNTTLTWTNEEYADLTLATITKTAPMYDPGVLLQGEGAKSWIQQLPNSTISPYRNLGLEKPSTRYGVIKTSSSRGNITLLTLDDFNALTSTEGDNYYLPDTFETVSKQDIIGFEFGTKIVNIPDYFLNDCPNLTEISYEWMLESIGNNFLVGSATNANFNQPLYLLKCKTIGNNFLYSQYNFNSQVLIPVVQTLGSDFMCYPGVGLYAPTYNAPLTVPSSVTSIGTGFMREIGSFTGPLTVECPASVLPADSSYVLATGMASSPMIRTGVTMKGTYAQAWMNALPNNSTGGKKRNLKLGN